MENKGIIKKQGFTLIEILAVITLSSIIVIVSLIGLNKISNSVKERQLEVKKEALVSAAEAYAKNNRSLFGDSSAIKIPIRTLVYYGYINSDVNENDSKCKDAIGCIIDPTTNESMNDEIVTIRKIKSIIQATYGDINFPETIFATFHANGATIAGVGNDFIKISCDIIAGETCVLSNVPQIERSGYEIDGWNKFPNSRVGLKNGNNEDSIEFSSNTDFYAITHKDVRATFYPNTGSFTDGNDLSKVQTCKIYNTSSTCGFEILPNVAKENYSFLGWYSAAEGGQKLNLNAISSDVDAYAQYEKIEHYLTIKYNGNNYTSYSGGSNISVDANGYVLNNGEVFTQVILLGDPIDSNNGLIDYNDSNFINFVRTDYVGVTSQEWYTDASGTKVAFNQADTTLISNQVASAAGCDLTSQDCEVTLKVNWHKESYTVYYYLRARINHVSEDGKSSCAENCVLECQNLPNKFTRNNVTRSVQCFASGQYTFTTDESNHMYSFMHWMRGKTSDYNCTRNCSTVNPSAVYNNDDGPCYEFINFSKVNSVLSQDSCVLIPNDDE